MAPEAAAPRQVADLACLLRKVTGEDEHWAEGIHAGSRLEGDLQLDSLEFAALAGLLPAVYGARADLVAYLASLDIDSLIGLTVGELARFACAASAAEAGG